MKSSGKCPTVKTRRDPVNEFYKKDVKKKNSASTGGEMFS
jgi:hypothetical protein